MRRLDRGVKRQGLGVGGGGCRFERGVGFEEGGGCVRGLG